jgi:hypothetical protein
MQHVVHVRPASGVWLVEAQGGTRVFTRASEAERWARQEAQSRADEGEPVELTVIDLKGVVAGSVVFHPRAPWTDHPASPKRAVV